MKIKSLAILLALPVLAFGQIEVRSPGVSPVNSKLTGSTTVENLTVSGTMSGNVVTGTSGSFGTLSVTSGGSTAGLRLNDTNNSHYATVYLDEDIFGNSGRLQLRLGNNARVLSLAGDVYFTRSGSAAMTSNETFSGSFATTGNTTLGDASGDTLTINAGTVTAPNATGTSSTSISNLATLDTRYATPVTSISTGEFSFTGTTLANAISVSLEANRSYTVDVTFSTYTATAVPGSRTAMAYTGTLGTNLIVFRARGLNGSNWASSGAQMIIQGSAQTNTSGVGQLFLFYSRYFIRTTTSGTLSLQGAQNVNDADPTKVSTPSIIAIPTGF